MSQLHVLVYGPLDSGVTDALRIGSFVRPLGERGIQVRSWMSFADDLINGGRPPAPGSGPRVRRPAAVRVPSDELRTLGMTALAWADVVMFRRWRSTQLICTDCEASFRREPDLAVHVRTTGHATMVPDLLLRPLVDLLTTHPRLLGDRAIVYDTDDDVLDYPDWTGFGAASRRERELIQRILGLADLVTTTTPVLAGRLMPRTPGRVRVIRNAVDPALYEGRPEPNLPGDPRIVYHGVPVRLRDYAVARPAVDALAAEVPSLRRVWLGAAHEPRVVAAVDEARPWVGGLAAFAATLVAARPDVGLAPLLDEPFNRAKSELHWLEYAMAGAPTVVSGFDGAAPYDVVRDGIDGLVARSPADWSLQLRCLVASPGLRVELAGRARERVGAEYTVAIRADEWADAFGWAAAHPGVGRASAAASG